MENKIDAKEELLNRIEKYKLEREIEVLNRVEGENIRHKSEIEYLTSEIKRIQEIKTLPDNRGLKEVNCTWNSYSTRF